MAKGINIFDSAKGKPKPSSSAKDKPTVEVDGIEAQLNELQNLKTQIANLETELDVVTDEIKTIAKEKFVELYLENGRNPNTFLLKDGSGCVMVIPTDKYISIKDEDRANQLIETYGEDIVTIDEKYYFNPEVLERNMKAIEKLIRDAKSISDADKQNLLIREVKYSVTKGTIDELYDYGEDMEAVINDIQPIITLKNCGGKMAEGGTDGEFIANVYDDYDAEVGTTVTSMYAKGGMTDFRMKYAKKDIETLQKEGVMSMYDTKYGVIHLSYNNGNFTIKNNQYNPSIEDYKTIFKGNKDEVVKFLADAYVVEMAKGGMIDKDKKRFFELAEKLGLVKNGYYIDGIPTGNNEDVNEFYKLEDKLNYPEPQKIHADGGMTRGRMSVKKLIDEIRENGEFMDSYMIDESQTVSNAGEQESYLYNGKNYLITTWNERAENHFDGEENISIDEEYKLGGFFGNSRYNTGRSWHLDHARHNKKESYEKPLNKRSRRFKRK